MRAVASAEAVAAATTVRVTHNGSSSHMDPTIGSMTTTIPGTTDNGSTSQQHLDSEQYSADLMWQALVEGQDLVGSCSGGHATCGWHHTGTDGTGDVQPDPDGFNSFGAGADSVGAASGAAGADSKFGVGPAGAGPATSPSAEVAAASWPGSYDELAALSGLLTQVGGALRGCCCCGGCKCAGY